MSVLSKLKESDQPSIGNSEFITEDIIQQVLSDLATWKSPNSESLGQLWLGLLKYVSTQLIDTAVVCSMCSCSSAYPFQCLEASIFFH